MMQTARSHEETTHTDQPVIRSMELSDIDEVLEIEGEAFLAPWSRRSFVETIRSRISESLVLDQSGTIAAYIIFYAVDVEAHIMNLAVRADFRRRGYAKLIIHHVISLFRERDVSECYLEVRESNLKAQRLYKYFGFEVIGRRKRYYAETGEDALVMRLFL